MEAPLVFKIRTKKNLNLSDDTFVEHCMQALMKDHPEIVGYMFERQGDEHIQIMMYGNFETT